MTVSELIERLKNAPAGSEIKVVTYISDDELQTFEINVNDESVYRIELAPAFTKTECKSPSEPVILYC